MKEYEDYIAARGACVKLINDLIEWQKKKPRDEQEFTRLYKLADAAEDVLLDSYEVLIGKMDDEVTEIRSSMLRIHRYNELKEAENDGEFKGIQGI